MIKDMLARKLIIPMEDPVEVSRKFKKKRKVKLPSLDRDSAKREAMVKKEEDEIRKRGIYFIKDADAKKVSMPRFADFRIRKEEPQEKIDETNEESPSVNKRHINIASTNPLADTSFNKTKKKKKKALKEGEETKRK
jgi:hypothetical protein